MKLLIVILIAMLISGCSYIPSKSQAVLKDMNSYGCDFSSVDFVTSKESSSVSVSCK